MIPGDRWILGQKVRYLVEAGRPQAADSTGVACAARATVPATKSWCLALVGYTAQQFGNYQRADAAFTSALAELPSRNAGSGRISHDSSEAAPPDRTGAWTASRATR